MTLLQKKMPNMTARIPAPRSLVLRLWNLFFSWARFMTARVNLILVEVATTSLDRDSISVVADYVCCRPCLTGVVPTCQGDCTCKRCSFCICPSLCLYCPITLCPGLARKCNRCDEFVCPDCRKTCGSCHDYMCKSCSFNSPLVECPICLDSVCFHCSRYFDCCDMRIGVCCIRNCVHCYQKVCPNCGLSRCEHSQELGV